MTDETWTLDSLHLHLTHNMIALDLAHRDRLAALDLRYSEQGEETKRRFHSGDVVRASLSDQMARLIPRAELDGRLHAIAEKINDLNTRLDIADGKRIGIAAIWGVVLGAAGLVSIITTVALELLKH